MNIAAREAMSMALESNNTDTDVEAVRKAAKWTRFTAVATACSAGTSLAWALSVIAKGVLDHMDHLDVGALLLSCAGVVDVNVNILAALMLAGLRGPTASEEVEQALVAP